MKYKSVKPFKMLKLNSIKNLIKFDALDPQQNFNRVTDESLRTFDGDGDPPLALYKNDKIIRNSQPDADARWVEEFFQARKTIDFSGCDGFVWPGDDSHHQEWYFFNEAESNGFVQVCSGSDGEHGGTPPSSPMRLGGTRPHRKRPSTNKRPRTARKTRHRTPRRRRPTRRR